MIHNKWKLLQLFAEGAGDGGTGGGDGGASATGEGSADAGHQRLLELGVPADKIRKNRAYRFQTPRAQSAVAEQVASGKKDEGQAPAATDEKPTEGQPQQTKRMSWDEIMADPEYNQEMQRVIQGRLRKNGQDAENHGKMADANRALARYYGLDPENIDFEALAKKVTGDNTFIEERAMRNGVDPEVQRKLDAYDAMKARDEQFTQEQARRQLLANHYQGLKTQAEAMKAVFPKFDLDKELETNKEFARLVGPGVNVPVEQAYKLCHQDEIMAAAAQAAQQQTAQKIANAIRSGSRRPEENGMSGQAPSVATFDYRNASKEQREALKQMIRSAGQRGEYIYPGSR